MANTAFQNQSLALTVGTPVTLNLASFCNNASSFAAVGTTRDYSQSIFPPGLSMNAAGLITGTPTTVGVTIVKVRAYRGARSADASWTARSAGAHNSQRFDTATPITSGGASVAFSSHDTSIKRSGAGSMRQFIPAGSSVNTCSKWFFSTKTVQGYNANSPSAFTSNTGFNLGEEFWIQYSWRPDRNTVQYPWGNAPKITILDMLPWSTNLNLAPTANVWEHVLTPPFGMLMGYHNGVDGTPWSNYQVNLEGDIVYQPAIHDTSRVLNGSNPGLPSGAGPNWTSLQQQRARNSLLYNGYTQLNFPDGRPDILSAMPGFDFDQWHTILQHVIVDVAPSTTIGINQYLSGAGLYEVYMAPEGQDYLQLFSETYRLRISQLAAPYFQRSGTGGNNTQATIFPGMCFTNLMFGIDISAAPLYQAWIDEIICSPTRPAAPDFDGTGSYRSSDVLVTFKVT